MADFPALPLWTDAYLADTTHLTDAERGRYDLMLVHMWRMPEKRFPNDDEWLARKFSRTIEDINGLFRPLVAEFFQHTTSWIEHKRIMREWHRVRKTHTRQSAAAKSRWAKTNGVYHGNAAPALQPEPEPYKEGLGRNGRSLPATTESSPASLPANAAKKGSRLAADWKPSETDTEYARRMGLVPDRTADDFRDYWLSKPGQGGIKLDWSRTWQMWCRTAAERIAKSRRPEPPKRNWVGL